MKKLLTYGYGDACARIRRSSMVALHFFLSSARCAASCIDSPSSSQSSFSMSIHLFVGLPLSLFPCTYPLSAIFGYLSFPILDMCPKYRKRLLCILYMMSCLMFNLSYYDLISYSVSSCDVFYLSQT